MPDEPENLDPRVLDASELPKRHQGAAKEPPEGVVTLAALSLFGPGRPAPTAEPFSALEPVDAQEIYDHISTISDPEHPLSLGQLAVVSLPGISVADDGDPGHIAQVQVFITPTVTHCSLATLIGLGIRVRLERCLPPRYRIKIHVTPGSHQSEAQVNKQLNDKERVAAACENDQLVKVIGEMLSTCV